MEHKLLVFNPSNYPRAGHVATAWQPIEEATGIPAEQVQVHDDGVEIPAQVDRIDPSDRRLDTLSFVLRKGLSSGPEDYSRESRSVFLTPSSAPNVRSAQTLCAPGLPDRIELANDKLAVSVSLLQSQGPGDGACFGGAAQSFRIRGAAARGVLREEVDMLDAWNSIADWAGHDPEKRCMQVDRLIIPSAQAAREISSISWTRSGGCS